jgi:hypothetical protein
VPDVDASALAAVVDAATDPLEAAARASAAAVRLCPHAADAEIFAFAVADFALASRLNRARPIPLLALAILHPSLRRGAGVDLHFNLGLGAFEPIFGTSIETFAG